MHNISKEQQPPTVEQAFSSHLTTGRAVLQRRLIFVPLPKPGPLHTSYRGPLPETKPLLYPCYIRRPLLQPGYLLYQEDYILSTLRK